MVLTRQGSGVNTLGDLRGKEIAQLEMGAATMGRPWLETLLMVNGFGALERFFGRIEVVGKPSSAVLPVFFGNKHACLVDMLGFEIMKELNPQIGAKLQVVAASESCVDNVICLSKDGWASEAQKQDTIRALGELHLEPAGQQILTIFKVAKLAPFQEAQMDTVKNLRKTYDQLHKGVKAMRTLSAKFHRRVAPVLGVLLTVLWIAPSWAKEPSGELKKESLSVGFTPRAFANMNRNDLEAAFKALAETLGRKRGYLITSSTRLFEETSAFEAAIKDGSVRLAVMDAWTYLSMNLGGMVTPSFVATEQGKLGKRYVVLTRQGSGLNTLPDLRGKDIAEYLVAGSSMGRFWLESLLRTNRLGTHETFFGRAESVGKTSAAVLPVFFGKKDACLVDEKGFDIMKELNPQVGKKVQAVAVSDTFVDGLLCLSNSGWASETFKRDLIQALGELHLEPAGQQILTLFKFDQLIPYEEGYLDTVKRLRTANDHAQKRASP